ncbi:MAG: hypothetical protein K2Y56_07360 [Methylobacterium sp.]|uniref:hypothetical protein n=1 Tax=Methylobacterium sp. TaxID=409 RepID=UPI0025FF1BFF|nr:hypothetical protein [Methylobacterium sp.]MBX9931341.1 hypothetical protein [Methylobacterium sp.]
MPFRFKTLGAAGLSAVLLVAGIVDASAACTKRVYNRSAYLLVGNLEGTTSFTVRPGTSTAIRLSRPGTINLAAFCRPAPRSLASGDRGRPVASIQLAYEAVLDKCFIEFGTNVFQAELGRGFFGMQDTKPFTVNNPQQGDIVLGPFQSECPM